MNEAISQDTKRGPGRPKSISDELPVKKGKRTWKPASLNEFKNKEPGFTYRMVRKDPDNLSKKEAEGWEKVSAIQGASTNYQEPGRINDGQKMTSVQEGKDWVLCRMPDEMVMDRQAYYDNENQRRVSGLTEHIKKKAAKEGTDTHGNITISSRNGQQVIE